MFLSLMIIGYSLGAGIVWLFAWLVYQTIGDRPLRWFVKKTFSISFSDALGKDYRLVDARCYTTENFCKSQQHWREVPNGHYVPQGIGEVTAIRWDKKGQTTVLRLWSAVNHRYCRSNWEISADFDLVGELVDKTSRQAVVLSSRVPTIGDNADDFVKECLAIVAHSSFHSWAQDQYFLARAAVENDKEHDPAAPLRRLDEYTALLLGRHARACPSYKEFCVRDDKKIAEFGSPSRVDQPS